MSQRLHAHRHRLITEENSRWWTLAAMCFALFMVMLDNTVVNVALPSIQKDLGATVSGLEWTVNAYTLAFAVLLVTGGRMGDIFGRRRMFLFGVVTFAASSAFIGFAQTEAWLERREDEHDRRMKRVTLTAEGAEVAGRIADARMHSLEAFAASLTDEQRRRLAAALEDL